MYPVSYEFSANPFIYVLLGAFALCLLALAFVTLRDTHEDTWLVRAYNKSAMKRLRLSQLLRSRGVDTDFYARIVPIKVIQSQIAACKNCPSKQICDQVLWRDNPSSLDYSFCPNNRSINRVLQPAPEIQT